MLWGWWLWWIKVDIVWYACKRRLVWLQLSLCNNPSLLTTWTGLSNCLHNIRPPEIFVLLFSNLRETFGSYQFCGNMLWQPRASVLSSYWLYVITYTFMMPVSCKLNHICPVILLWAPFVYWSHVTISPLGHSEHWDAYVICFRSTFWSAIWNIHPFRFHECMAEMSSRNCPLCVCSFFIFC